MRINFARCIQTQHNKEKHGTNALITLFINLLIKMQLLSVLFMLLLLLCDVAASKVEAWG